jgi:O-acetylhomoserine (thiol)-lyase
MAAFLAAHDAVAWANHPSLPNHPDTALTTKYFPKGAGSIVCFGVKGGRKAGEKAIERVELFSHLANVGDAKSLILHPASTTHQQLTAAQLEKAGIGEDMIRLSIGLEDVDDLMADLDQALRASQRG